MNIPKQWGFRTDKCAFCHNLIERNYWNACEECYNEAQLDPETFIADLLNDERAVNCN